MKKILGLVTILIFVSGVFNWSLASTTEPKTVTAILYVKKISNVSYLEFSKRLLGGLIPTLQALHKVGGPLQSAKIDVLLENSSGQMNGLITQMGNQPRSYEGLKALMESLGLPPPLPYEKREIPFLDLVVRFDLAEADLQSSIPALAKLTSVFSGVAVADLSLSKSYTIIDRGTASSEDEILAFVVPWKPNTDHSANQDYWLNHHGPLAKGLIEHQQNPNLIKSYVQVQTEIQQPTGLSDKFQGICFEVIPSALALTKESLTDPNAMKTSQTLAIDEYQFSEGPAMILFKRIKWSEL